jgi:Fe-S-cluster formation regulator IscX/YfhJ
VRAAVALDIPVSVYAEKDWSFKENSKTRVSGKLESFRDRFYKGTTAAKSNRLGLNENVSEDEFKCGGGGGLTAEHGLSTPFKTGGKWDIIKDLKGYPTHEKGGVDLVITKDKVIIKDSNGGFKADKGLLLTAAPTFFTDNLIYDFEKNVTSKYINDPDPPKKKESDKPKPGSYEYLREKYGISKGAELYGKLYNKKFTVKEGNVPVYFLFSDPEPDMPEELRKLYDNYHYLNSPKYEEDYFKNVQKTVSNYIKFQDDRKNSLQKIEEAFINHPLSHVKVKPFSGTIADIVNNMDFKGKDAFYKALFVASFFNEGADQLLHRYPEIDPEALGGYHYFGLDTIGSNLDKLIKVGYIDPSIKERTKPYKVRNNYKSLVFSNFPDILDSSFGYLRYFEDYVSKYAEKNNINLSPEAKMFFAVAAFNGGEGRAAEMMKYYNEKGLIKGDKFLDEPPPEENKGMRAAYNTALRRMRAAKMLLGEGYIK